MAAAVRHWGAGGRVVWGGSSVVEQWTENPCVGSSILPRPVEVITGKRTILRYEIRLVSTPQEGT